MHDLFCTYSTWLLFSIHLTVSPHCDPLWNEGYYWWVLQVCRTCLSSHYSSSDFHFSKTPLPLARLYFQTQESILGSWSIRGGRGGGGASSSRSDSGLALSCDACNGSSWSHNISAPSFRESRDYASATGSQQMRHGRILIWQWDRSNKKKLSWMLIFGSVAMYVYYCAMGPICEGSWTSSFVIWM